MVKKIAARTALMVDADVEYTQTLQIPETVITTGSYDAVATATVHQNAYLVGVQHSIGTHDSADNCTVRSELSRSGNEQITVSDQGDAISIIGVFTGTVTDGMATKTMVSQFRTKIFFRAGDRLYLNTIADIAGTTEYHVNVVLFWRFHESEI